MRSSRGRREDLLEEDRVASEPTFHPGLVPRFHALEGWAAGDASTPTQTLRMDSTGHLHASKVFEASKIFDDVAKRLRTGAGGLSSTSSMRMVDVSFATAQSLIHLFGQVEALTSVAEGTFKVFDDAFLIADLQLHQKEPPPLATALALTIGEILHEERLAPRLVLDEDGVAFDFVAGPLPGGGHTRFASLHLSADGELSALIENRTEHQQDSVWAVMQDAYSIRDAIQRISAFLNG